MFSCFIEAGVIDPAAPIYELARALNIAPVRVRSLVLNWQLRSIAQGFDLSSHTGESEAGAAVEAATEVVIKTRRGKNA